MKEAGMMIRGRVMNAWVKRWIPAAAWMALIFVLSAQSMFPLPGVSWLDEVLRIAAHLLLYAALGFLLCRAVMPDGARSTSKVAAVLIWAAAYAVSDEWRQSFVPGRDASLFDWAVDMLGALAGCAVYFGRMKDEG